MKLKVFERYLLEQEISTAPDSITQEVIQRNVKEQGLKTVSINTRLRAIRSYFNFLYKQKHIRKNPVKDIKLLKDRKEIVQTFTNEQLERLLKQPNLRTFTGLRDYVLMLLLLETGIRVNELIGIALGDI